MTEKVFSCLPKIQGWCSKEKSEEIIDNIIEEQHQIYVEIGVYAGASLLPALAALTYLRQGKVFAIDPWSNSQCIKNLDYNDPNRKWWKAVDLKQIEDSFLTMLKNYNFKYKCKILKCSSDEALKKFEDNSIDFLHVDGNSSEESTYNDVKNYFPKIKDGGYILLSKINLNINGSKLKGKAAEYF